MDGETNGDRGKPREGGAVSGAFDIENELGILPAKVGKPFEALRAAGMIDDATLEIVFRAGRRAGDVSQLLGFAVGYLFLQSKGVPIHDVIRMSEELKRRIKLSWSERRWRDEHSRLSRAVTLQRLAGENIAYDVTAYATHLPRRWPGYLIKSSRRLGMEGLRQRHCVASYHNMLLANAGAAGAGRCAIGVVFLDRQRWTVQLYLTNDVDKPLRLGQIRTRNNAAGSREVAEAIHEILGVEFDRPTDAVAQTPPRFYWANLRRVLAVLRELGTRSVQVSFDGSGDSGSIWNIDFVPKLEGTKPIVAIERWSRNFDQASREWGGRAVEADVNLEEAISEATYDYLECTDVDWYNNDGGYGDLTIDVEAGTTELAVHQRYTESTCEFHDECDIMTGDSV